MAAIDSQTIRVDGGRLDYEIDVDGTVVISGFEAPEPAGQRRLMREAAIVLGDAKRILAVANTDALKYFISSPQWKFQNAIFERVNKSCQSE